MSGGDTGNEYAHIQRLIAKSEEEENLRELVTATRALVARVKLDLLVNRAPGWGGGVVERVEAALAKHGGQR